MTQPAETSPERHGLWAEFGHASQEVFAGLGLGPADLERLVEQGVI